MCCGMGLEGFDWKYIYANVVVQLFQNRKSMYRWRNEYHESSFRTFSRMLFLSKHCSFLSNLTLCSITKQIKDGCKRHDVNSFAAHISCKNGKQWTAKTNSHSLVSNVSTFFLLFMTGRLLNQCMWLCRSRLLSVFVLFSFVWNRSIGAVATVGTSILAN